MIKVFKLRDIIKYLLRVTILLGTVYIISILIFNNKDKKENKKIDKAMIGVIEDNIGITKLSKNDESVKNWGKVILDSELKITDDVISKNENVQLSENVVESKEPIDEKNNELAEIAEINVETEEIPSGVQPRYSEEYNGVRINNSTDYTLTEEIMNPDNISIEKGKAIIYHTHTCESYTPTEENNYEMTGNYRTTDLDFSVVRVGDELEKNLSNYGWNIVHNKTCHDYPSYNGSYARSLNTAKSIINENGDTDILIDLHRDAIADSSYAPKVKIGDEIVSQLMFVIGTDATIAEHKNWNQNLKFAIKVQEKANELYPGLFKPIILRNSAYNQYLAKGACIIEVGATGNTLEESNRAMKYLARVFNEL